MKPFQFYICLLFVVAFSAGILSSCKTKESATTNKVASDTTASAPQQNPIHTSGEVKGGTIINGAGQDNAPNGAKPKQ